MTRDGTNSDDKKDSTDKILSLDDGQRTRLRRVLKWAVMLTTLLVNIEILASLL